MKKNLLKIYGFILILLQSAVIAGCDNDDKNSTMNSSLANLGDFYYSDGTWSSNLNSHNRTLTKSPIRCVPLSNTTTRFCSVRPNN